MKKTEILKQTISLAIFAIFIVGGLISAITWGISNNSIKEVLVPCFFFGGFIILLLLQIKKALKNKAKENIEYSDVLNITFTGKLDYKGYRNYIVGARLKNPMHWALIIIMIFFSIFIFYQENSEINHFIGILLLFGAIIIAVVLPIRDIIKVKMIYKTNKGHFVQITYKLDNEGIQTISEYGSSSIKWTRYYKILETNEFFILYLDISIGTFIDKKMFTESEIIEFQKFIKSLKLK
jgi:hypothetical protein